MESTSQQMGLLPTGTPRRILQEIQLERQHEQQRVAPALFRQIMNLQEYGIFERVPGELTASLGLQTRCSGCEPHTSLPVAQTS